MVLKNLVTNVKFRHNLFVFTLTLFVILHVFGSTFGIGDFLSQTFTLTLGNVTIEKGPMTYFRGSILLLLLLKTALDTLAGNKPSLSQLAIFLLVFFQAMYSHSRGLLFLFAFALAARDIDIKIISKIVLVTLVISMLFVAVLSLSGGIPEYFTQHGQWYRPVRRSLGFTNPNIFAHFVAAIILACFAYFEPKFKTFITIVLIFLIAFFISGSRCLGLEVLTLLVAFYVLKNCSLKVRFCFLVLFPLLVILNLVFLYQYSAGPIETWLDNLSSHRFFYIYPRLQYTELTFFGDPSLFHKGSDPFDNSYAYCILKYGALGATVFLLSVFLGIFKNLKNTKLLALCFSMCAAGFVESRLDDPVISFPLIKILFDGWDLKKHI